jgi:hypothetical protein
MAKRTLEYEVAESLYKADLELLSKYQAYSEELLRLALLFLVGYGFLLKELILPGGKPSALLLCFASSGFLRIFGRAAIVATLLAIVLAAAGALVHRYCSTDGFANSVSYHRFAKRFAEAEAGAQTEERKRLQGRMDSEYKTMLMLFHVSTWALRSSAIGLGVATGTTALSFLLTLFACA